MTLPLLSTAAHVFVADLGTPALDKDDAHHLARVLRLRPGEAVTASDGAGGWCLCRYVGAERLEADGPVVVAARPHPLITIAFAPVKGDRPEWTVQKLTEVGVDRIGLLAAIRSVVRWDGDRALRQVERLTKVARQAAMQSRRLWLPEIGPVRPVVEAATALGSSGAVVLAHPEGDRPSLARPAVLIGPEGGWAEEELALGLPTVALGPTVLRAETASMGAGMLLMALRAGLVGAAERTGPPDSPDESEDSGQRGGSG